MVIHMSATKRPKSEANSVAKCVQNGDHKTSTQASIPPEVLDDLAARFVINMPKQERQDLIRVLFQLELAHWHYLDFICRDLPLLPRHNFSKFCVIIFRHIPFLVKYIPDLDSHIEEWMKYKKAVPTCGAILLDSSLTRVLLVQGYWGRSWGFPKGKINQDEPFDVCATREVKEETGYDCSKLISDQCYIERVIRDTTVRLYIVRGVDKNFEFKPIARNEIKDIKWFDISELPVARADSNGQPIPNANQFFNICPFVRPLKKWISREKQLERKRLSDEQVNGHRPDKLWVKSWDNIKFDWDSIWKDINKELEGKTNKRKNSRQSPKVLF